MFYAVVIAVTPFEKWLVVVGGYWAVWRYESRGYNGLWDRKGNDSCIGVAGGEG